MDIAEMGCEAILLSPDLETEPNGSFVLAVNHLKPDGSFVLRRIVRPPSDGPQLRRAVERFHRVRGLRLWFPVLFPDGPFQVFGYLTEEQLHQAFAPVFDEPGETVPDATQMP